MSIIHLLFSFEGRTRRLHYWLTFLAMFAIVTTAMILAMPDEAPPTATPLMVSLLSLIFLYPMTAVCVKRTNDIGWSPVWAWMLLGISLVVTLFDMFQPFGDLVTDFNEPNMAVWLAVIVTVILSIAIGCIRSADGRNAHGPSPLSATA